MSEMTGTFVDNLTKSVARFGKGCHDRQQEIRPSLSTHCVDAELCLVLCYLT
jgi:hypothetical protein